MNLPYFNAKGLLLTIVYLLLSVFFVFFVPKSVPNKSDLETIKLPEDSLKLIYNKSANTSYFSGSYKNAELKTIELTFKEGLKLYGTNEVFIQLKERPKFYELMIYKNKTLFNNIYTIYQLSDSEDVLIPYNYSAKIIQKKKNQFFFISLAFLALIGFILIRTLIIKKNNN